MPGNGTGPNDRLARQTSRPSMPYSGEDRPTPKPPGSLGAETSALMEAMELWWQGREARIALRLQTAAKAEQSAALTMAEKSNKRLKAIATGLGTALAAASLVFSAAWGVYRDARTTAIDVATSAEQKAVAVERRVDADESRQIATETAITQLRTDVDQIGKAVNKLVVMLEPEAKPAATEPAPKRRPR